MAEAEAEVAFRAVLWPVSGAAPALQSLAGFDVEVAASSVAVAFFSLVVHILPLWRGLLTHAPAGGGAVVDLILSYRN
jgi:hypothetical protein